MVIKELAARIRALLRRVQLQEAAPPKPMVFGDLEIRREQGVVLKDGEPLALTKTEFLLLCEFADHADMVLSRDQLLERVWGYDYLGDSRLVDAHVRRLRVKVEDQPEEPKLILTVRGIGYRLHSRADVAVRLRHAPSAPPGGDRPQERFGLVAVAGAAHGREGPDDVPAVAGLGQARVEDGEHAPVVGVADQPACRPGPGGWPRGEVDAAEGGRARALPAGLEQRLVRPGEGQAVDGDERERAARDVDALEQPGGGEEARRLLVA